MTSLARMWMVLVLLFCVALCGCNTQTRIAETEAVVEPDTTFHKALFQKSTSSPRVDVLTAEAARSMIEASPRHTGKVDAKLIGTESSVECGSAAGWWNASALENGTLGRVEMGKLTEKGKAIFSASNPQQDIGYVKQNNRLQFSIQSGRKINSIFMRNASKQVPVTDPGTGFALVYYTWCWNDLPREVTKCGLSYEQACSLEKSPGVAQFAKSNVGWILGL